MERINLVVASVKALWSNSSFARVKSASWGYSRARVWYTEEQLHDIVMYRITDANGQVYLWSTQKDVQVGDEITASVKGTKEYKGTTQIVLTRGTIKEKV